MKAHPLAALFPMLEEAALQELAWDIRTNGLLEPIVQLDGMILDGRNRFEACQRAEVEPRFVAFTGSDALAFVASKNLHRRQLTTAQRAIIAAQILDLECPPVAQVGHHAAGTAGPGGPPTSQRQVAAAMAVGRGTVQRAIAVVQHGAPELVEATKTGRLKIAQAAELATRPVEEQLAALAHPPAKPQRRPPPASTVAPLPGASPLMVRLGEGQDAFERGLDILAEVARMPDGAELVASVVDQHWGRLARLRRERAA